MAGLTLVSDVLLSLTLRPNGLTFVSHASLPQPCKQVLNPSNSGFLLIPPVKVGGLTFTSNVPVTLTLKVHGLSSDRDVLLILPHLWVKNPK